MEFDVLLRRREGRLLPRHVMWSTRVRGDLFITDEHDKELNRHVRTAVLRDRSFNVVAGPLHDMVVVSAKPDWWTMTGWERVAVSHDGGACAFQQSWISIPGDRV
jgi:hypothetical protein